MFSMWDTFPRISISSPRYFKYCNCKYVKFEILSIFKESKVFFIKAVVPQLSKQCNNLISPISINYYRVKSTILFMDTMNAAQYQLCYIAD